MRPLLLAALLACACAPSNERIVRDLRSDGRNARYDKLLDAPLAPVPLHGPRPATLPMIDARIPTVMGRVNGVEMPVLLDTGTTHVMVSGEAASKARVYISRGEPVKIISPGYTSSHQVCVFDTLELGGNRFGPGVATVPLRRRKTPDWAELPSPSYVIAGCAILSHFRVTFDFERREVRLMPHGRKPSVELLHAPVEINGQPFRMMVDSGATNVVLEPWAARNLGLMSFQDFHRHQEDRTRETDARYSRLELRRLDVHGKTFRDVRAVATQTFGSEKTEDGVLIAGLLGLQAFGRRVWTVDYGRRILRPE